MSNIIRLKSYKSFLSDGRSSTTNDVADKTEVLVAVIVGTEPLKIVDDADWLNVDDVILDMAEHIKKLRKIRKAKGVRR